jgi:hypothetical protein
VRADAGGTERWAVNAVAMTAMGGAIAEVLLLGNTCEGHWADSEKNDSSRTMIGENSSWQT